MWPCFTMTKNIESDKEKFFLDNGSRVLEQLIASCNGKYNPMKSFSVKELEKATNNYDPDRILLKFEGYGHFTRKYMSYILYKGTHQNRTISVKKFSDHQPLTLEQCINEVVIASQITHRNVLQLLGYCLETQIPILVYESVGNGNFFNHIYQEEEEAQSSEKNPRLSWETKVRIVMEIAEAVNYLHTATSKPIIHRGIKSKNILLDESCVAKLFDFGLSVSIPFGETYVEAEVIGSFGFLAPESLSKRIFTEKTDVYGFGAVLFEILTGKKAYDISKKVSDLVMNSDQGEDDSIEEEEDKLHSLSVREKLTKKYLNANTLKEGNIEQLNACSQLALRCMKLNPEERLTMKEVVQDLRRINNNI